MLYIFFQYLTKVKLYDYILCAFYIMQIFFYFIILIYIVIYILYLYKLK